MNKMNIEQTNIIVPDGYPTEYWMIRKALVREIGEAATWMDAVEACHALLRIRQIAESLKSEHDLYNQPQGQKVSPR
jgi:hypothetical protein